MKFSTTDDAHGDAARGRSSMQTDALQSSATRAGSREPRADSTVADLGEHALIEHIRARVPPPPEFVQIGIGDDAAVVEPMRNALDVITTDCLVEGIHFDRTLSAAADIGHKALAVNLSDLAAMGATPRVALLSLALPGNLPFADFDGLLDGLLALARESRIALIGGNIARSPGPLVVDITVVGAAKPRRVLTRAGARAGDDLYVSGTVGGSAAGLASLLESRRGGSSRQPRCEGRHRRPQPRLRLGGLLARTRTARACIDLSDGLADGVRQLARASGLGASIDAGAVPVDPDARAWFEASGQSALDLSLTGGEDYELLFAVSPRKRRSLSAVQRLVGDLPITRIGQMTAKLGIELRRDGRVEDLPSGFAHFEPRSEHRDRRSESLERSPVPREPR
jgi:thiamine-monophosphate kinase